MVNSFCAFGAVDRDARTRIISVAYFALLPQIDFAAALKAALALALAELIVPWSGETGGPVEACSTDGETLSLAFAR